MNYEKHYRSKALSPGDLLPSLQLLRRYKSVDEPVCILQPVQLLLGRCVLELPQGVRRRTKGKGLFLLLPPHVFSSSDSSASIASISARSCGLPAAFLSIFTTEDHRGL